MSRLDPNTGSYHAESLNVSQMLYDVNNPHMIAVKSTLTQSFLRSCILPKKNKQKTVQTLLFICIMLFTVIGSQL